MTREERLDWLCRLRSGLVWFDVPPKERPVFEQVLSEVIKSIEQEPCEDAVNRKEIQKKINRLWNSGGDKDYCMETLRDFVIEAPFVTPTRKKGKWERGYSFPDGEYVKCTVCGEIIKCIYPMHFCPNCGAEMESEK